MVKRSVSIETDLKPRANQQHANCVHHPYLLNTEPMHCTETLRLGNASVEEAPWGSITCRAPERHGVSRVARRVVLSI